MLFREKSLTSRIITDPPCDMIHTCRYTRPGLALDLAEADGMLISCLPADPSAPLPAGAPSPLLVRAMTELDEYLAGRRRSFDIPLKISGTDFQRRVRRALTAVGFGQTESYSGIAAAIGAPRAARAVAGAIAKNPLLVFVPCHRIIRRSGEPGGYCGGKALKETLLAIEANASCTFE